MITHFPALFHLMIENKVQVFFDIVKFDDISEYCTGLFVW